MKLTLALICALAVILPVLSTSRDDSRFPNVVYHKTSSEPTSSHYISFQNWIPNWIRNALSMTKDVISRIPAKIASTTIKQVCMFGKYTGLIRPTYTPPSHKSSVELFTQNGVQSFAVDQIQALLNNVQYKQGAKLIIFVSTWEDSRSSKSVVHTLAWSYNRRLENNFVVFNAGGSTGSLYSLLTFNTKAVGQQMADVIVQLAQVVPMESIHVIGHGTGAHVAGVAGRIVSKVLSKQIPRITALDPSPICYDDSLGWYSLKRGDAAFIDVIHTNNGVLGKEEALGDADFYPNGKGSLQPGCMSIVCAHDRAVEFYAESVIPGNENNFLATRCTSYENYKKLKCHEQPVPMGYATPNHTRGTYFLDVNSDRPFGKNGNSYESTTVAANVLEFPGEID